MPENSDNTQADKTFKAIEHHAIRLPKGGGAIRGIGEKFQANPATGSGSFSIPLPISPGRGEFQPDLNLSYDSGSGNSAFGLGWSIGIPSIARKTDKELPRYLDNPEFESDTFVLAGAEDLVPVLEQIGSQWNRVKRSATETEDGIERTYNVYPYRPRIEGLFARIEKWMNSDNKEIHWRVTTKENITSIYGKSAQARAQDGQDSSRIFEWFIEESFDAKGNRIHYEYKQEDGHNLPSSISEIRRAENGVGFAGRYVKRIQYSPFVDSAERFHFQLLFDYGEHTEESVEETTPWSCRLDPYSTYKSGFEIRTYRLCRRVLMFHNFPEGDSDSWELVKSLELEFEEGRALTYLSSATIKGYQKSGSEYRIKSMPSMAFSYTQPETGSTIKSIEADSAASLPSGIDQDQYQWVDLSGEGISGILSRQGGTVYYKENLGGGKFGAIKPLCTPTALPDDASVQISDVDGDGVNELILRSDTVKGYYRYADDQWESFISFNKNPVIDWNDPNLKMIDLSGDGHPDILITEDDVFRWYPSKGKEGYDSCQRTPVADDELRGPALIFNDPTQSIYLSDMSGDGLTDIVRIRDGEVCYWPNLGYGRFGEKVFMDNSPKFDSQQKYNPAYIKLGDIDGSGTTDIIYLGNGKPRYYLNLAGNGWSDAHQVNAFLPVDSLSTVSLIDLLGTSTLCLVWSSDRPNMREKQLSYVDLMGVKPHLLSEVRDNMGSVIKLSYAPSTKFYLEDKAKGTTWITRLSFPVHCLELVETIDEISGSRLVTRYQYHHGYFDGVEREFRGFGMVETIDTETFEEYSGDPEQYVAPILTKTWFHTGAFVKAGAISRQYAEEYYKGDGEGFLLPDTVLEAPSDLPAEETREAYRALKGSALRQETYEPGVDVPYQVEEANFTVKRLQPMGENKHAVLFTHQNETITFHYEKVKDDPRVAHEFALEVDEFGNIKKRLQLVYPRRSVAGVLPEQQKAYATLTAQEYINQTIEFYRVGLPIEEAVYELGKEIPVDAYTQLSMERAKAFTVVALADVILPEVEFSNSGPQARLVSRQRQYFWDESQTFALPFGQTTARSLMHHIETAELTPGLVHKAYGNDVTESMLSDAGYVVRDGIFCNPGLVQSYTIGNFYLPTETRDPFGGLVRVSYDDVCIYPVKTEDALGNTSMALMDYRTLSPYRLIDANQNVSEVMADEMGMVMATSVYGTEAGVEKGDSPLYDEDGNPIYENPLYQREGNLNDGIVEDILVNPLDYLQEATTYFYYDLDSWQRERKSPHFVELARETHVRDLAEGETTRVRKTIGFTDGFERELQSKVQVEPGLAWVRQPDNSFKEEHTDDRWLTSGRTLYNNKQKPIKQYEPFYSAKAEYEDEAFFAEYGVTPIIRYDPLLRVVRTDTPKGFFSKVEFTPWEVYTYDENDTVKDSQYYAQYSSLPPEEQEALDKAAVHYNTPKIARLDTLGREFMRIDNLMDISRLTDENRAENELITYSDFTITGKARTITDPRQYIQNTGRKNYIYTYDMQDEIIRTQHIDGGDDRVLYNVLENAVLSFDARGSRFDVAYDLLQRPVTKHVSVNGLDNTVERLIYGEDISNAEEVNLRGQLYRHYDQAGRVTTDMYSFKGEPIRLEQRIREEYKAEADWQNIGNWDSLLESESYNTIIRYNAFGLTVEQENPDGSRTLSKYHLSGNLNRVDARLKGETGNTGFVTGIQYNPKGQREKIGYGNGTETNYTYERETFRLIKLITTRESDQVKLQNIAYTFDPIGNITLIEDRSHETVFNNNQIVEPKHEYTYDPLYRLIEATGREHEGLNNPDYYNDPDSFMQSAFVHISNINDANKLANYTRRFTYDPGGNLLKKQHIAARSQRSFTREIAVDSTSNRWMPKNENNNNLLFDDYYDQNGNVTELEHLREVHWNYRDNIASAVLIKRDSGQDDAEYYVYDSSGQRVRKIRETLRSATVTEIEEKIYLGTVEIKRIRANTTVALERSTLHVMDDIRRIAVVHNWSIDQNNRETDTAQDLNRNKARYQYGNHLDSASLELDTSGLVISYEEYFPYGGTSFIAGTNQKEVKVKEYRYTGKERDEATGLYYFGARYYAPWVGRWLSCDPLFREGLEYHNSNEKRQEEQFYSEGLNVYDYVMNNPIKLNDSEGKQGKENKNPKLNNFVILVGGPGIYEGKDPEHDKAWYSYIEPILKKAKKGTLATDKEQVQILIYEPAYRERWKNDRIKPSWWERKVQDSDLSVTRYEHTQKVIKYGASDYLDYIEKKVAEYNKGSTYQISIKRIKSAGEFWEHLKKLPDKSISRVWFSGHASDNLWLSLYHDPEHRAVMLGSKTKTETVQISDIESNKNLINKFVTNSAPSKFYGCNTMNFAKKWHEVFKVTAEGSEGKVSFKFSNLADLEKSSTIGWRKFNK